MEEKGYTEYLVKVPSILEKNLDLSRTDFNKLVSIKKVSRIRKTKVIFHKEKKKVLYLVNSSKQRKHSLKLKRNLHIVESSL